MGGTHFTWWNADTDWFWPHIHQAEERLARLVSAEADATGERAAHLRQACREALLLQASDWPFLVTTGQAKEYAAERFTEHLERFNQLADLAAAGQPLVEEQRKFLAGLKERDNPFPDVDYRVFAARQGQPLLSGTSA